LLPSAEQREKQWQDAHIQNKRIIKNRVSNPKIAARWIAKQVGQKHRHGFKRLGPETGVNEGLGPGIPSPRHQVLALENEFGKGNELDAGKNPTEDELRKMKGQPPYDAEPDDDKGYPTINW